MRQRVSAWNEGDTVEVVSEMALRMIVDCLFAASSDPSLMRAVHEFAFSINEYLHSFGLHPSWLPSGLDRRRRFRRSRESTSWGTS